MSQESNVSCADSCFISGIASSYEVVNEQKR